MSENGKSVDLSPSWEANSHFLKHVTMADSWHEHYTGPCPLPEKIFYIYDVSGILT